MNALLKKTDRDWCKHRVSGSMYFVMGAFAILVIRLFYLQIIEGEELRRLSENNCIRLQSLDASRGVIFDRNGELLVENRPSFDLNITLRDAKPVKETLKNLSKYTGIPLEELSATIGKRKKTPSYKKILLKQDIGRKMLAAVEVNRFDLPGVTISIKPIRDHIYKSLGAHLTGYLGEINKRELTDQRYAGCKVGDYVGKFGIEKAAEHFLRGRRGGRQVEVNARGQVVRVLDTVESETGHNIYLTIDKDLQRRAEELVKGKTSAVVAMDPQNGDILAMVSSPWFDPNAFAKGLSHKDWQSLISNPFRPMENKVIQGKYPPASTYKIITAIAGLEENVIDESTSFFCPGHYKFGDRVFRCWKRGGHGRVNVVGALAESCDVYFYQVGQKLGVDRLAKYAKKFGLGSKTRILLDHEAGGLVPTAAWKKRRTGVSWQSGETLSIAIGQGYNLVTPLQLVVMVAGVGNGGVIHTPKVIKRIETSGGKAVDRTEFIKDPGKPKEVKISEKNLKIIKRGLWEVVNSGRGTARIARLRDTQISGKTGTAQVVGLKRDDAGRKIIGPNHLKDHAWFVAYAPSESPVIAVSVIVEHGEHGSSTASPIARDIIKLYMEKRAMPDLKISEMRRPKGNR